MSARVTKGSKEFVEVNVFESTGSVTDLSGAAAHFDVYEGEDDTGTNRISNQAASASGLQVHCLVDTSTGTWNVGRHALYIKFTVGSEVPRLGPFELYIT